MAKVKIYGVDMRWMLDLFFNDELDDLREYVETIEGALEQEIRRIRR